MIDVGLGSLAKEKKSYGKNMPSSYLLNTVFANYRVLIDTISDGYEKTLVAELELQTANGKLRIVGPTRLTCKEVRQIRSILRMLRKETAMANGRREKFFKKIYTILAKDKKNA